jgi:hypothetical protein
VNVSGRIRPLIAIALAVIVVAGLVTADVVTLHQAKPSYDHETQALNHLVGSSEAGGLPTKTTVAKSPGASTSGSAPVPTPGTASHTTTSTTLGTGPGTNSPGSGSSP